MTPGDVLHHGFAPAEDPVHQRGLADVGATDHGDHGRRRVLGLQIADVDAVGRKFPVALVDPGAVGRRGFGFTHRVAPARLFDEVEKMCHDFGFGHVTAVDDHCVLRRTQGRHRPRRVQVVATPHVGQHCVVVADRDRRRRSDRCGGAPAPRPTPSGRSSRSASGSTTVPMSRPSTTTACRAVGEFALTVRPAGCAPRGPPTRRKPPW